MSKTISENLLMPLVAVFGEPKTSNAEMWLSAFEDTLKDFSPEEMQWARGYLLRTHKVNCFPTPAECLAACEEARRHVMPEWLKDVIKKVEECETIEDLDALWFNSVNHKRNQVSKSSFDTVKTLANYKARQLLSKARTDWVN